MKIEILLIPIAMTIQLLFLFKRELLADKLWKKWIWIVSGILFLIALIGNNNNIKFLPLLMMPIISFGIFNILLTIYRKIYNKSPVDTFYSMDIKLLNSGVFNFVFWVLGIIIPIVIIYKIAD